MLVGLDSLRLAAQSIASLASFAMHLKVRWVGCDLGLRTPAPSLMHTYMIAWLFTPVYAYYLGLRLAPRSQSVTLMYSVHLHVCPFRILNRGS